MTGGPVGRQPPVSMRAGTFVAKAEVRAEKAKSGIEEARGAICTLAQ
jgi:hypothetical protein